MRIIKISLLVGALVASLMAFPSVLPWMVLSWIVWHWIQVARGKPGWLPLLVCVAIVCIKLPGLDPSLAVMLLALSVTSAVAFIQAKPQKDDKGSSLKPERPATSFVLAAGLGFIWIGFWYQWQNFVPVAEGEVDLSRPIVCLGDSLTDFGYPQILENLIAAPVEDFGRDGITTSDGIKLLPEILHARPSVVVIELGGHDYNQRGSRADIKRNLKILIESCHEVGAEVVLVEIPRGFVWDPFYGLERELAREYQLQLVPDSVIRRFIFWSPICPPGCWLNEANHLSTDGLHPNQRGNRLLAEYVLDALKKSVGPEIER